MTLEQIKVRIAELLEWDRDEVDSFSLPALRSFARGKDKNFDHVLEDAIDLGQHIFVKEE